MAKQAGNVLEFDINKYFGDLNRYVADFKAPSFDFEGFVAIQRKNFEALTAANKLAAEAMQAVLKRQTEILRQAIDEVSLAVREVTAAGTAPEKAARQAELAKEAFERGVANVRELSEMVAKSNLEAGDLLNKRFSESLDEVRAALLKMK
jgi:phasin family protein